MVFSQLSSNEKDAFFGLLDEYFASRPELFKNASSGAEKVAASAVHKAFTSPAARQSGLEAAKSLSSNNPWSSSAKREPSPGPSAEDEQSSTMPVSGRVAAAAAALATSSRFASPSPASNTPSGGFPKPPPRSNPTDGSDGPSSPSIPSSNRFPSAKSSGDVDTSSAKNAFNSLRSSMANKSIGQPPPSASSVFGAPKRGAPPPMPPSRPKVEEEEPEGEWAEVLYDYSSEDPGDLEIKENQRVLVVDKSSDDWWTAELDGRKGLIPAAYVKLL